jgi:diaminopimelate decarboxylase
VKEAINELAHVYAELVKLGAGLKYIDVGGGLGVDYDGSGTNFSSSMNYTLVEYANDVVYRIASVCNERGLAHPMIVSESGRAIARRITPALDQPLQCAARLQPGCRSAAGSTSRHPAVRQAQLPVRLRFPMVRACTAHERLVGRQTHHFVSGLPALQRCSVAALQQDQRGFSMA